MVRWIQSGALLDLADELAGRGAGPGVPRPTRLRRSISTSCYAAHEISFRAVASYLRTTAWGARQAEIARDLVERAGHLSGADDPGWTRFLRSALGSVKIARRR